MSEAHQTSEVKEETILSLDTDSDEVESSPVINLREGYDRWVDRRNGLLKAEQRSFAALRLLAAIRHAERVLMEA